MFVFSSFIYVKSPQARTGWLIFISPLDSSLWLLTFASLLLGAFVLWLTQRLEDDDKGDKHQQGQQQQQQQRHLSFPSSLYLAVNAFGQQGKNNIRSSNLITGGMRHYSRLVLEWEMAAQGLTGRELHARQPGFDLVSAFN